jgi:hypothetical protein
MFSRKFLKLLNEEILMKKTLTYLLVVVALVALASTASAVTCTIDQHPAATLLVPYFQVHLLPDGTVDNTSTRTDTLITVVNASSQATLAHVDVWNRRSVHVLDFMIALTAFDEVSFSMADVLTGHLPSTPDAHSLTAVPLSGAESGGQDVCQRSAEGTDVYPDPDGFLRFIPTIPANPQDNTQATTQYASPAFGTDFAVLLADALDYDASEDCPLPTDTGDGDITGSSVSGNGNLSGYVTIDMANYCSLSNPSDITPGGIALYWQDDAAGWENNLWGDYIIVSNSGIPTLGAPTVQIEAALDTVAIFGDGTTVPMLNGSHFEPFNQSTTANGDVTRTFYARYWEDPDTGNFGDNGTMANGVGTTSEIHYMTLVFPFVGATNGDNREPLGLRYGARYLNAGGYSSAFRVWRSSQNPDDGSELPDLTGSTCSASERNVLATIYDTDENTTLVNGCPSPCPQTHVNFPYETQRVNAGSVVNLTQNGWIYINFLGAETDGGEEDNDLDQAWIDYEMSAGLAFVNASVSAVQLDPSSCNVVGLGDVTTEDPFPEYAWPVGLGHP